MNNRAGFRQKNVRNPLQFALSTYFTIWMIYPVLWLLLEGIETVCVTVFVAVCAAVYVAVCVEVCVAVCVAGCAVDLPYYLDDLSCPVALS